MDPYELGTEELNPPRPHGSEDDNYPSGRNISFLLSIDDVTRLPLISGEKRVQHSPISRLSYELALTCPFAGYRKFISHTTTGSGTSTLGATAEQLLNLTSSLLFHSSLLTMQRNFFQLLLQYRKHFQIKRERGRDWLWSQCYHQEVKGVSSSTSVQTFFIRWSLYYVVTFHSSLWKFSLPPHHFQPFVFQVLSFHFV